jgi:threonine dehydrogenase-like Zn-dependent dehydrogenase
MKAIVQDVYGSADVLELRDIPQPMPRDGEVLIRVRAAGVDQGVWHLMTGLPYLVRLFGFGLRKPKVPVRGREVAGVVEAVGAGVNRLRVVTRFSEPATDPSRNTFVRRKTGWPGSLHISPSRRRRRHPFPPLQRSRLYGTQAK